MTLSSYGKKSDLLFPMYLLIFQIGVKKRNGTRRIKWIRFIKGHCARFIRDFLPPCPYIRTKPNRCPVFAPRQERMLSNWLCKLNFN